MQQQGAVVRAFASLSGMVALEARRCRNECSVCRGLRLPCGAWLLAQCLACYRLQP